MGADIELLSPKTVRSCFLFLCAFCTEQAKENGNQRVNSRLFLDSPSENYSIQGNILPHVTLGKLQYLQL